MNWEGLRKIREEFIVGEDLYKKRIENLENDMVVLAKIVVKQAKAIEALHQRTMYLQGVLDKNNN